VGVRCKSRQTQMVDLQQAQPTRSVVGSFTSKARYKLETPLSTSKCQLKGEDLYCNVFANFLVFALVQGKSFRQLRGSTPPTYTKFDRAGLASACNTGMLLISHFDDWNGSWMLI
jgi:hypothetical protein